MNQRNATSPAWSTLRGEATTGLGVALALALAGTDAVTPIIWQPTGGRYDFPARYPSIVDRYIANVAAASGSTENVYSIDTEYYEKVDGVKQYIRYGTRARPPIVDRAAFPRNGCEPARGYHRACITDQQPGFKGRLVDTGRYE